jgi:hypothetical protein
MSTGHFDRELRLLGRGVHEIRQNNVFILWLPLTHSQFTLEKKRYIL